MPLRVLLSPQFEQERRHLRKHSLGVAHLGVTAGTERDHQVQKGPSGCAVMHDDGSFAPSGRSADTATVAVALEHSLTEAAEVCLIPPLERVAGRAEAAREDLPVPAAAIHRSLDTLLHNASIPFTPRLMSVSIQPSFHGLVRCSSKGTPFTRASPPASKSRPQVCGYRSRRDDSVLRERLQGLAREHPRFAYRRLHVLLRRDAVVINHKRVQRVYREMGLSVKRNRRKRLTRALQPRPVLTAPGQQWSIDFANDVTASGRRLRVLSAVDSFTRQRHVLEVDTSFPSRRVTRVLDRAIERFGKPQTDTLRQRT